MSWHTLQTCPGSTLWIVTRRPDYGVSMTAHATSYQLRLPISCFTNTETSASVYLRSKVVLSSHQRIICENMTTTRTSVKQVDLISLSTSERHCCYISCCAVVLDVSQSIPAVLIYLPWSTKAWSIRTDCICLAYNCDYH